MRKLLPTICCVLLLVSLAGCGTSSSSANLVDEYRAPGTLSLVFERVAVLVLNGGPDLRSRIEAQIVASARQKNRLFAAHSVLTSDDDMRTVSAMRQKLLDSKFDGVVALRLLRPEEVNPAESQQGVSFSSYASSVSPGEPPFGEGRMLVEVTFYDLKSQDLVWRGVVNSEAKDPASLTRNVVDVVRDRLRETGLVHD